MENRLEIFKNEEFGEIRTMLINGEPYFVGKDVAISLGYSNPQKAIRNHVDEEDRGVNKMGTPSGEQELVVINESGVYSLVFGSKLKSAKKFKRWVTSEVLPTIRKQGEYKIPKTPMETLALMFEVQKDNAEKIEKLDERVTSFEENAPLSPSEYNVISNKVHERIRVIKSEYGLVNATKRQNAELYRSINHDVKQVAGVYTRAQLRQKDFERVMELIRDWTPSKALMMKIDQIRFEF